MTTFDAHVNFGYTTVTTAPTPATSGTSLIVTDATVFPTAPFNAVIWPIGTQPTKANAEIVTVTAITVNTLTITRAQEFSTARTVIVGDQIANAITKKVLTDVEALAAATSTITTTGTTATLALPVGKGPLYLFINNATTLTIQGIVAGIDGQELSICAIGAGSVVVNNLDAAAAAANRIVCTDATNVSYTVGMVGKYIYDLTAAHWRAVASPLEEGTWTPSLVSAVGSGITYTTQIGSYVKIGRFVVATFAVALSGLGTASGQISFAGLPFTVENIGANTLWDGQGCDWGAMTSSFVRMGILPLVNTKTANISGITGASQSSFTGVNASDLSATTLFRGTFCYKSLD